MQYSDTTNKLGIIQSIERYINVPDAYISGDSTRLKEMTAMVNQIGRKVWHTIFTAYGGWQYDDANQSDLPAATTALVASQTSYAIPTGALTVRGVEIKDESSNWTALTPLTEEITRQNAGTFAGFSTTAGTPLWYQLVGNSVRIFPASDYSQSASLKMWIDRGSVAFVSTDTTATPGFASEYHDILPIGAALEYTKIRMPDNAIVAQLRADYLEITAHLIEFYSKRFMEYMPARFTVRDSLKEYA